MRYTAGLLQTVLTIKTLAIRYQMV